MSNKITAPAGGRRFWVAVVCFAIANAAVWVGYDRWQTAHRHSYLEVRQFTPADGSSVSGRPTLAWSFNLDVAPPTPKSPPPGAIAPNVPGKWQWTDPRTLTFSPDEDLPRATPIRVTLSNELHTPDGLRLAAPFSATLRTPALKVLSSRQEAFDEGDRVILELTFSDKVAPSDVWKHLSLLGSNGRDIHFHPHGEQAGKIVRVVTDPVTALIANNPLPVIRVEVTKGLTGSSGPLGLEEDFSTRVSIAAEVLATDARGYFPAHDEPTIHVEFNNPIDLSIIRQITSIKPATPFTISSNYDGINLHGKFDAGTQYEILFAAAAPGLAGKRVPRPTSLSVVIPDRESGVWFENEFGYLGSEGNRAVLAHVVNMTDLRATVTRVYDSNIVAWRNASHRAYWQSIDPYSRPLAVRDYHLPVRKNQQQDLRLLLDDLLGAEPARDGIYQISLTSIAPNTPRPNWTGDADGADSSEDDDSPDGRYWGRYRGGVTTMVTLSDIGLSAKSGHDGVTVWATSLRTAKPLAGVRVRLYSSKSQILGEETTGADGVAKIESAPAGPGEKPAVLVAEQLNSVEVRQPDNNDTPADPTPTDNASPDARRASAHLAAQPAVDSRPAARAGRGLTWLDLRGGQIDFGDADTAGRPYLRNGYEAFCYADRGVYRPGETVHLRAIVRGPDNTVAPRFPVRWQIRRPDLHDWKSQMAEIDADGATSLDLALPTDLPPGRWTAHVGLPGEAGLSPKFFGSIAFDVEDYMPQRMKVSLDIAGVTKGAGADRVQVGDDPIVAHVQADYLFGRPVTERPATLVARIDPIPFQPGAFRDWTFGDAANTAEALGEARPLGRRGELPETELNAAGHARFDVDVNLLLATGKVQDGDAAASARPAGHRAAGRHHHSDDDTPTAVGKAEYAGPWRLTLTGSVAEAGGRAVTATRIVDVDRVPHYLAVRSRETAPRPGVASAFDVRLVTPAGAIRSAAARLDYTLYRETWNSSFVYENSQYHFQSTRILESVESHFLTVADGRGEVTLTPPSDGSFVLAVRDPQTHAMTSIGFFASDGSWDDNISREHPESLELVVRPLPDLSALDGCVAAAAHFDVPGLMESASHALATASSAKLRAGGSAQVIVRSPFAGQLLLAIETDGVIATKVVEMPANHIAVPIQIPESCRPNGYVTATVIRAIDPNAEWTIHRAVGVTRLAIDNSDRKLTVELATPQEIRPETSLGVALRVMDSAGNPVENAAVTVAAVDEGICQLTGFTTPDPYAFFTATRGLGVASADLFGQLMPEAAPDKHSSVGGDEDAGFGKRHGSPVGARRVRPVALVSGVLHTDAQGVAHADFPTPQFIGQLRVMAVASAEKGFGSSDAPVLMRSPLVVQSSWPRFAAPGDRFTVPITLFNNSAVPGEATISVQLDNGGGPLRLAANNATSCNLPPVRIAAMGQASVAFDVLALQHSGVAHIRLTAAMGDEHFEESLELPVRPASPTVAEGQYVTARPGASTFVEIPPGFVDGTTRFDLSVAANPPLQLPQGLDYLDRYPYGCVEQTTSTLFPLVYLNDIGPLIAPRLFDKAAVADKVHVGMLRLLSMQTSDGGLSMWPGEREDWPWGSVYAAHFLVEAQAAGHEVPETLRDPLLGYVRGLLNQAEDGAETIEVQSYAAYVLALAGKPQRPIMSRLSELVKSQDAGSARFHLAAAWLAAGRRDLAADLIPSEVPVFRMDRQLRGNVGSAVRDRAILISTLLAVDSRDPRIPGLVQQLCDEGKARQWRSTQDVAFSVLAIGRYLRVTRSQVPYETAQVLLEGKPIASATDGKPLTWTAAWPGVLPAGAAALPPAGTKLEIRVTGRPDAVAHVAWLESGVKTTPPPGADSGVSIRRRYLDERGNPLPANRVRSGDLVQVELTVQSADSLENVVIDDLLPAGLEIENPRLQGSAAPASAKRARVRDGEDAPAFRPARSDMHDDRLVLVGDLTHAGAGTYIYTARAVTAGKFILPPVKAECMYDLGINSLWGAGQFEVLPAERAKLAKAEE